MSNEKNIFEIATREKYRFFYKGSLSVEDLWVLSVTELDSIFKELNSRLKEAQEESLLDIKSKKDAEIEIRIEIVKHIVKVKLDEAKSKEDEKLNKLKKQRLLELIASKKDADLNNKSVEELQKMLNELGD